jgi:hypothetical protein
MSDIVQKLWGFCHTLRHDDVAPTGSRLYRRLATGVASANPTPAPIANRRYSRLPTCAT